MYEFLFILLFVLATTGLIFGCMAYFRQSSVTAYKNQIDENKSLSELNEEAITTINTTSNEFVYRRTLATGQYNLPDRHDFRLSRILPPSNTKDKALNYKGSKTKIIPSLDVTTDDVFELTIVDTPKVVNVSVTADPLNASGTYRYSFAIREKVSGTTSHNMGFTDTVLSSFGPATYNKYDLYLPVGTYQFYMNLVTTAGASTGAFTNSTVTISGVVKN